MPIQYLQWQVRKDGFETAEAGEWGANLFDATSDMSFALFEKDKTPSGMVWVEGENSLFGCQGWATACLR